MNRIDDVMYMLLAIGVEQGVMYGVRYTVQLISRTTTNPNAENSAGSSQTTMQCVPSDE